MSDTEILKALQDAVNSTSLSGSTGMLFITKNGQVVDDAAMAPATLPTWLEAMRPVDSFRSVMDMESSDSQSVESAGPLAGLRGVLMAEPVVAMPRAATIGSAGLESILPLNLLYRACRFSDGLSASSWC